VGDKEFISQSLLRLDKSSENKKQNTNEVVMKMSVADCHCFNKGAKQAERYLLTIQFNNYKAMKKVRVAGYVAM